MNKIVRLHEVPNFIVSDINTRFQVGFWYKLQEAFGTKLNFSTAFHHAMDGQTNLIIQTLEDMLRACISDFKKARDEQSPLIEFLYNNNDHSSIGMPLQSFVWQKVQNTLVPARDQRGTHYWT